MTLTDAQAKRLVRFEDSPWKPGQDNHSTCLVCRASGDIGLIITLPWEGKGAMATKKRNHRERHQFGQLATPSKET